MGETNPRPGGARNGLAAVNFWDFLDRWLDRRAKRRPTFDGRLWIGAGFLLAYYVMVFRLQVVTLPERNVDLVRDAMLVLGPGVGLIVGAIFRSDRRDDETTANTGEAFRAIRASAEAAPPPKVGDGD